MPKHPVTVQGFDSSLRELAQLVCRLRYDKLESFFYYCADELGTQANADYKKGRKKLSGKLDLLTNSIAFGVVPQVDAIFNLCKPHMKDELASFR